ncbi:putative colanic acid biosynthesis UDP-glucose lipid carrier transferase [Roseivirga pacifica]|uniref:Putative colanic acid biosysnthesis UDP-glucose lipid carrier transferase n=1 Tax=Roseivirga pacifica TaxID=1267423 RepID=A0A1I0N7D2_9BACT|nr:exopolysaccharide biosynthesis polyprenyl glycosylphosphotransferase [Roseivirga pacifica]RKQ50981.1 putative colanic acid biosynthesis UDP-glucose lipid carrier transferase [Roseivirga pacifica]SEV97081.1 putative colanic acid biosysnthesis UDP-glucose lipid carrier transferase [Roseivirga pacifica]
MKKRFNKYFPPLFILGEVVVLTIIFFIALYVAFGSFELNVPYSYAFIVYILLWPIFSYVNKDYNIGRAVSYNNTFKKAFASVFIFVSSISLLWLFVAGEEINRQFIMALVLFLFLWLTIYRVFVHLALDRYRAFGGNIRYAAIVGYDKLGFKLFDLLKKKPHYGIRSQGIYFEGKPSESRAYKYPQMGSVEELIEDKFKDYDFIYISDSLSQEIKDRVIEVADFYAKKVKLLPEIKTDALKTFVLRRYESIAVIDVNNLPLDHGLNRFAKRAFDIVFSGFIVVFVLSWLYPLLAILIKRDSKGPVLFKQWREGKDGDYFLCYKFRTMVVNSQADTKWASPDDPRMTKIGAFLRKTSLDEFPQFVNVFLGQMSVVGPRPHPISLNDQYKFTVQKFAKRHEFKPGVTGLAQSMGYRGEITDYYQMNSRVKLDRFYLQNWSFLLDMKIILLTMLGIAKGQEKAY